MKQQFEEELITHAQLDDWIKLSSMQLNNTIMFWPTTDN